jgi:hypothetical protein
MNTQELIKKISELKGVKLVDALPGTFMNPVPFFEGQNIIHFVRPVAEGVVLMASSINAPTEEAIANADRILNFGCANLPKIVGQQVTRIQPFDSGNEAFDTFLALGPSITNFVLGGAHFLKSITTECFAINHIEFAGDETEAEATVRNRHVRLTDVKREITPMIFCRYQKQTGQRSADHLAIAKHDRCKTFIQEIPRDGGFVELENWERARLVLTGDQGTSLLEATFANQTKTVTVEDALELMDALTYHGAVAAQKAFTNIKASRTETALR